MKFFITVVTVFIFQCIHAQSDTNHVLCDSVVMSNGSVEIVQIQEVKRNKVIYVLCCEDCAVPREFKRKNIDTLIYTPKHRIAAEVSIEEPKVVEVKTDPSKYFEVEIDGYKQAIYQGKKVTVKIDTSKYRGVLGIINDSTISVDNHRFSLSEIDMIAKPRTGKTIGLAFAQLPIMFTGFVLTAWGATAWGYGFDITDEDTWIGFGGIATMGIGIGGAILESKNGKRYPRFKTKKDGTVIQKWSFSIKSLSKPN